MILWEVRLTSHNMDNQQSSSSPYILSQQIVPLAIQEQHLVPPPLAKGDLIYSIDGVRFNKIPIGTSGQVLTVESGLPAWGNNVVVALTGTTPTIDLSLGNIFTLTLPGSATYSIKNPVVGKVFMVEVKQGSGTMYTNTWFSGVVWVTSGGTAPVETTVSNGYTTYGFRVVTTSSYLAYLIGTN